MAFNPEKIIAALHKFANGRPLVIAYSGGIDSHVLLHLLATSLQSHTPGFRAIHINHGLHSQSAVWAEHCEEVAKALKVEFSSIKVDVRSIDELGLEAAARLARYSALHQALQNNECLVTAQHQQDQAETLLLQLFRGAGVAGLSAMAEVSQLNGMTVIRPLLNVSRKDIEQYAYQHQVQWVEDPSNTDTSIQRNYLRHQVWPLITQRWPQIDKTISRSASHCREAQLLIQELAELDCQSAYNQQNKTLSVSVLQTLSASRQRNVLRYVIEQNGFQAPSTAVLTRIQKDLINAAEDSMPVLNWGDAEIRRYRDDIILMHVQKNMDLRAQTIKINDLNDISLADGRILKWQITNGVGLKPEFLEKGVELRFRQGGEEIRIQGHQHHKSLKKLFQEWGVEPWQRAQIPLLFLGDELIAVIGHVFAEHYAADIGEKAYLPIVK